LQRGLRVGIVLVMLVFLVALSCSGVAAEPGASWPASWIQFDWDKNENGPIDDWRDVEYAYYQYDSEYLYLKLECYDTPGKEWPNGKEGRYKWFIDLEGNLYHSGENIFDAEYLIFVEDTDNNVTGEMYLLFDTNGDNNFGEYEPWPPTNYTNYSITDPNVGGWRIVSPYQIEMYISWNSIGNPSSYWITWATDQENPNLDQGPTTDHVDEEQPVAVNDVAAIGQTPTPTSVAQGETVTVEVVVENQGTQTETFNVTCYFDAGVVGTQLVTNLAAGNSITLNFSWDTTGVTPGTYNITAWADSDAAIAESDETDNWCTAPATVTVRMVEYYLTVETDPAGIVAISGEGWYGNCTYVNLTAPAVVPNVTGVQYRFDHWTVDGNVTLGNPITVHMDANHTATAQYVTQYYLTVVSPYGTPGGMGWYNASTTAYATLNTGTVDHGNGTRRVFVNWTGDATGTGTTSDPITMDGPKTAIANWKTQYYLTVSSAHGTPGGEGWYNASDTAYATITPLTVAGAPGVQYVFTGWSGDASGSGSPSNPITMDGPKTAVAEWKTQYLVTFDQTGLDVNATGTVVTVNGSAKAFGDLPFTWWVDNCSWVEYSYSVTVSSLDPNENFTLVNVTGPVSPFHTASPVTVTGNYQSQYKVQYYLDVSSDYGTPGGMGWYYSGTTAYATLDTGVIDHGNGTRRVFTHWSGDATGTDYSQSDPVTMDSNKAAIANWKTQYYLTVRTLPLGLNPAPTPPSSWYDAGTEVDLTAPDLSYLNTVEYEFLYWDVDGPTVPGNPITVKMNMPHTASAHYSTGPVGGILLTINKPESSSPWIGLTSALIAIMVLAAVLVGHKNGKVKRV